MKFYIAARALLRGIDHACIKGPRVDVQGYSALICLSGIDHAMHRLPRIDCAWIYNGQLNRIRCAQAATPRLNILKFDMEIFHGQFSDWRGHPAILVAMIVDGTALAYLPANGDKLVKIRFINQVASVMLAIPG
jgi:hypothetical protein